MKNPFCHLTIRLPLAIILFSFLFITIPSTTLAAPFPHTTDSSSLVALYMVGSTLEMYGGQGTIDIHEIFKGLGEPEGEIDVIVAYGGTKKPGWSGMTIATLPDLKEDNKNGIIGDEGIYQACLPDANMGDASALYTFLTYLESLPPHSRNILIFWDHGAAAEGLCIDQNHNDDLLSLSEVSESLKNGGIHWDLIGMDACLMGTYEVAGAVADYADMLVVSEETIPGSGWDYESIFKALRKDPSITMEELGKIIIDSYLADQSGNNSEKTLSLIDLKRFGRIQEGAGELGRYLSGTLDQWDTYKGIGSSWFQSHRFGYDMQTDREYSIDMLDFSLILSHDVPDTAGPIRGLEHAIADAVLYQGRQKTIPGVNGLSMYSPRNRPIKEATALLTNTSVHPDWKEFLNKYLTHVARDRSVPVITDLGGGRYQITDDMAVQSVMIETSWQRDMNTSHFYDLKGEPVYPGPDGIYVPNPDDKTFYLQNSESGDREMFYHQYLGTEEGIEYYRGMVQITRDNKAWEVYLYIMADESGTIEFKLVPFRRRSNGDIIFLRDRINLKPGDLVTPLIKEVIFSGQKSSTRFVPLNPVLISGEMRIVRDQLPYGAYYPILVVKDHNENYAFMDIGKLRLPNTATIIP